MFTVEQVKAAIAVVEGQRAAAVEAAIQLAVRCTDLEVRLAAAEKELADKRPLPSGN